MRRSRATTTVGEPTPVLVVDQSDGRSRSAVAAVRALRQGGFAPLVAVSGGRSAAAASRSCAGVVRVPSAGTAAHRETVEKFLARTPGSRLIAASDGVLVGFELPGADLVDKATLPARAAAAGLSTPPTRRFGSARALLEAAGDLDYPVVVKAVVKGGGEQAARVDTAAGLASAVGALRGPVVVQPFVSGTMRAVVGVIQDGRLLAVAHQRYLRIWPPGCGTASAAVTTLADPDVEERLPRLLEGHAGVFQVQLVDDQVIDVNPRVYGSLPLAVAAGVNLPAIACRAAAGELPPRLLRGRPGVRYRWLDADVRRVVHDVRCGELSLAAAGRELRPHRGTAHSVESLVDPGPGLVRLLAAATARLP